jgi:hypothetical protein
MSNLTPYNPALSGLTPRDQRSLGRGLSQLQSQTVMGLSRVDQVTELQAAKAEATAQVAGRAMQSVAVLSQLESQLIQAVPLAASRLEAIGNVAALAAADVVADTTWKLKRC